MPKAYAYTRYGGPETQAFIDVDRPVPGPGKVLVAVRAAGVNTVDWKLLTDHSIRAIEDGHTRGKIVIEAGI